MIDSITLFSPHSICREPSENWEVQKSSKRNFDCEGNPVYPREYWTFRHKPTGLRAWGTPDEIKKIEASLPRVLHGTNGKLLIDDNEIHDPLAKVKQIVREIGNPVIYDEYFSRVDLVWQFQGNPADFLAAHHDLRHGKIRRQTSHYDGQSITWPGDGLRIQMYDKALQMTGKPGGVVRVEVQLRGERLVQELGEENGQVIDLSLARCYQVYRRILLGFKPAPLAKMRSMDDFLALAQRNGWKDSGVPLFDLWARGRNRRYVQAKRSKIAKIVVQRSGTDWNQLLPEDAYPPVVEVEADKGVGADEPNPEDA